MKFERIGNIANFINGAAFKPEDWENGGLKIIRIQNLTDTTKPYNYTRRKVADKYLVRKGDVLVSWSATIDVFIWNDEDALLNQHIFKVDFDYNKVDKKYFIYALKKTITDLSKFAHGSTMKHVVKSDFDNHKIPLPSLTEQIHIANILTKAENLIAQRKESIRLLDEYLKSTFLDMFGDPVKNEKGWEKVEISSHFEVRGRVGWKGYKKTDLRNSGPYVLGATHLSSDGTIDLSKPVFISQEKFEESPEIIVMKNDLLIVQRGNTIGKVGLVNQEIGNATINPCILILRPIVGNTFFLRQFLMHEKVMQQLWSMNTSSAQPMLTQKDIRAFSIYNPPMEIQTQFAQIVEKTESLKVQYQQSLQELENLYGSLSQRAFKGQLTPKEYKLPDDYAQNSGLGMAAEP